MNFKRFITAVATLAVMVNVSLSPAANNNAPLFASSTITASAANKTIADERAAFPNNKYWNHAPRNSNNPRGYTSNPCTHHNNGCNDNGSCGCNATANWNIQCMGFADQLAQDIYGTYAQEPDPKCPNKKKYKPWSNEKLNTTSIKKIKRGDVVRNTTPYKQHSFMIIEVTGTGVRVAECNRDFKTCKIEWDRFVSNSELTRGCYTLYHAPYPAPLSNKSTEPKPALGTVWVEGDTYFFTASAPVYSDRLCKTKVTTIPKGGSKSIKRFFTAANGKDTIGMIDSSHYVYVRQNNVLKVRAYVTTNYKGGVNLRFETNTNTNKNILCEIPNNKRLQVSRCTSTWAETTYGGYTGWVHLSVCKG